MYRHDAVVAFAQQLGINAEEESDFFWIAEVGLQSPLPPRWGSETDMSTGFVYYIDHDRGASSWENPLVPYLRRVVEIGRTYLEAPSEDFFEDQKSSLWNQHKLQLAEWQGPFADEQGRQFYMNSTQGVSSWQDPRVEAQYLFDLECGLVDSLEKVLPGPEPDTPGWADDDPWCTDTGAEILTLDDGLEGDENIPPAAMNNEPKNKSSPSVRPKTSSRVKVLAQKMTQAEHKSTLASMSAAANWIHAAQLDDHEAQRILLGRRAATRKKRRLAIRAAVGAGAAAAEKAGVGTPADTPSHKAAEQRSLVGAPLQEPPSLAPCLLGAAQVSEEPPG